MATGPEHYRKAEELLADITYDDGSIDSSGEAYAAAAQVHATLALAAALGTYGTDESRTSDDTAEWERVAGEYTRQSAKRRAAEARERAEEQAARDAEADAFHAQRRADEAEANGEYVDYAEAEAVRDIHEEMALEAAGVESWDQL